MISLSKIIKRFCAQSDDESFEISIKSLAPEIEEIVVENEENQEVFIDPREEIQEEVDALNAKKAQLEDEVLQIEKDIQERLDEVQADIEKQKAVFQEECESYRKETYHEAYDSGYQKGILEGKASFHEKLEEAKEIIASSHKDYTKNIEDSEETILKLAIQVANQVLRKQLLENEEIYVEYVKSAIKHVKEMKGIRIRVSPDNYQRVNKYRDEFSQLITADERVYIIPDDELTTFDYFIDSESGRVDAGLDTQIEELQKKLLEILGGNDE